MGKNKNKAKKTTKQVSDGPVKIKEDDVLLDEAETSVIQENSQLVETDVKVEPDSQDDQKKLSVFLTEYDILSKLREDEKDIRQKREDYIKANEKEFEKKMKEFSNDLKKIKKDLDFSVKKLKKLHTIEVKKASKEKRKRNGKNMGGFTTPTPVPKKLVDFLELEDGAMLTRPNVFHLMSEKFIQEGLKSGQEIKLDKKNAKKLGKPAGYVIAFSKQQTFLASFYNEEKVQKEITV